MIRVGMLGVAHVHAAGYVHHLLTEDLGARPVAVYDGDEQRARSFAERFELDVCPEPDELCRRVDAVVVTGEHVEYPQLVAAAASAGRPILCEKPLGVTEAASRELLETSGWLSVAFPVRYASAVRGARHQIEEGRLGRLVAMSGTNHGAFPGGFFGQRAHSGGGAIIDHVVHLADTLRWLTGCNYQTVFAEAGQFREVGDVEDCAQVVATTTEGAWASIDPSWSRPAGMPGANDLVMTLWFEHGQLRLDAFAPRGALVASDGRLSHRGYGTDMDTGMLRAWVGAITAGGPPPVPALDGWKATQLALGAAESARTHQVVTLPPAP